MRAAWILLAPLLVLLVMFVLAACGGGGGAKSADVPHGRVLFMNGTGGRQACAFCHSLKAAEGHALLAPVLDLIIGNERAQGLSESQVVQFVLKHIHEPTCTNPNDPSHCMPYDLVKGQDAKDVATFVARCADRPLVVDGCGPPASEQLTGEAARGRQLFTTLRCQGCHSTNGNVALAPTFKGLAGSKVELADGSTVTADDNYLKVSILAPDVQVVKGFKPGYMTSVIRPGQLTAAQAKALVAFIKTVK